MSALSKRASELLARFPLPTAADEHWRWFRPEALNAFGKDWFVPDEGAIESFPEIPLPIEPDAIVRLGGKAQTDGAVQTEAFSFVVKPKGLAWFSGIAALQLGLRKGLRITPKGKRLLLHRHREQRRGSSGLCEVSIPPGQELEIIEYCTGTGAGVALAATRLVLGRGARVRFVRVQQEAEGAHLARLDCELAEQASLSIGIVELGAQLSRLDLGCELAGEGACLQLGVAIPISGRRRVDVHAFVRHRAARTQSQIQARLLASGRGQAIYDGLVRIEQGAAQADANQQAKGLLLSERAEIDAKPELEIEHDDVRAAHGCAIGGLNRDALFYLQSRGIPFDQAQAMLVRAFLQPALLAPKGALSDALLRLAHRAAGMGGDDAGS